MIKNLSLYSHFISKFFNIFEACKHKMFVLTYILLIYLMSPVF